MSKDNIYGIDYRLVPNFNLFMASYVSAILFTEESDLGTQLCNIFCIWDLPKEFYAAAYRDCLAFVEKDRRPLSGYAVPGVWQAHPGQAGMDFWYSRNGHGAGFETGDGWEALEAQEYLAGIARSFGEADVYIGDDGVLYYT